jgi:hypothetical protein
MRLVTSFVTLLCTMVLSEYAWLCFCSPMLVSLCNSCTCSCVRLCLGTPVLVSKCSWRCAIKLLLNTDGVGLPNMHIPLRLDADWVHHCWCHGDLGLCTGGPGNAPVDARVQLVHSELPATMFGNVAVYVGVLLVDLQLCATVFGNVGVGVRAQCVHLQSVRVAFSTTLLVSECSSHIWSARDHACECRCWCQSDLELRTSGLLHAIAPIACSSCAQSSTQVTILAVAALTGEREGVRGRVAVHHCWRKSVVRTRLL